MTARELYLTLRHSGAMRSIEPGISRFRVWSFGPSQNDNFTIFRHCDPLARNDGVGYLAFSGPSYAIPRVTAAWPNFLRRSPIARSAWAARRPSRPASSASDPGRRGLTTVPRRRDAVASIAVDT